MADSDGEYPGSDDDIATGTNGAGPSGTAKAKSLATRPRGRAQAKWEAAASSNWELQEGAVGSLEGVLGGLEEAGKRKRYSELLFGRYGNG